MESSTISPELLQKCVNTIRLLGADQPQIANSGHPGAPMGMAPIAHLLWTEFMNYSPSNDRWFNRDRFILSNGHACALLYSMLHLTGYDLSLDDLKAFRKVDSKTPGHPEANHTPGVEVTTGPLGQGIANAVGLAIAEAHFAARFNKPDCPVIDNYTYVFCGDGCLQEGVSAEASSLAGHLGLGKLILFYDDNHITIDGDTDLSFTEDVLQRYKSYGWHVQAVENGDEDYDAIRRAIAEAKKNTDRPSLIKVRTTIGYGSEKAGTEKVHGSPLGKEDLAGVKKKFGFDPEQSFVVPEDVREYYSRLKPRGDDLEKQWNARVEEYEQKYPDLAAELKRRMRAEFPEGWESVLPTSSPDDSPAATRALSGVCINKLAEVMPDLIGGSADLNPSNLTYLKCSPDFQKNSKEGRNIRFGVREHAMSAICNGLAAYGGTVPYCATFLNFIGYAYGAVILSAISQVQVIYVMTHDSIGLGEDGPTHQPIEKYALCRSTPNMLFLRPCDGNEVSAAYIAALRKRDGPSVLALSRQNVPALPGTSIEGALKGAYVIRDTEGKPDVTLVSTGTEVSLCTSAADKLQAAGCKVRVVSMPCWELFEEQSTEYKHSVFLPDVPVLSVEAGATQGWSRYAHASLGVDRFGYSGPAKDVYAKLGLTVDNISKQANKLIGFFENRPVPRLLEDPLAE
ncbi:Transketolase [Balamuthia mandrillaris]